jgi:hypothetical protein
MIPNESPVGTEAEREKLLSALTPYLEENESIPKDSFCTVPESVIELDTPPGVSSFRRQYPLPHAMEPIIKETVDKWLADGTIERAPTDTAWNSPLTLAPKKDAFGNLTGKRPCLDPRHINNLLKEDRYPLPLIDEIFDTL